MDETLHTQRSWVFIPSLRRRRSWLLRVACFRYFRKCACGLQSVLRASSAPLAACETPRDCGGKPVAACAFASRLETTSRFWAKSPHAVLWTTCPSCSRTSPGIFDLLQEVHSRFLVARVWFDRTRLLVPFRQFDNLRACLKTKCTQAIQTKVLIAFRRTLVWLSLIIMITFRAKALKYILLFKTVQQAFVFRDT